MRVVIAPESEVSGAVRDCLMSWSRAGLLAPFCLWTTPLGDGDTEVEQVSRIEDGEARSGSLAEALEGIPSDRVALVGFYAAGPEEGFDTRYADAVERCIATAKTVLAFEKGRPVESTVMLVPEQIGQEIPTEVFCGTWNLYVAPEDRAAPPEANQLPDSSGLLPPHAAHALATVADLWANASVQPTGTLEAVAGREVFSIDPPAVRVIRCFSRVIDLGYLPDHVAAGVFKAGGSWPNPDHSHFDRPADPSRLLGEATRELIAAHREVLGLTDFQPLTIPPEKRPNLLEALRELFQMVVARIRRLPSDVVDSTLGRAHDRLAEMIDRHRGSDAPATLRWRERPSEDRALTDLVAQLDRPLYTPDGPTAAAWRDLRQLALGLIDGSLLPEGLNADVFVQRGKRTLVTKPDAIVPDPELTVPGRAAERPCDPLALDPRFVKEEAEGEDVELVARDDDVTRERGQELEEWLAKPSQTLLWRVGVEIASALEAARQAAAELETASDNPEEDGEEEEGSATPAAQAPIGREIRARWRRFRNGLLASSMLAIIASVLAWTELDLTVAAFVQAVVVVIWTVVFLRSVLSFVHRERKIMREQIVAELAVVNAATGRAVRAGDLPRLERRYEEYLDWAEIIGWMAHHPWVGEPIGRIALKGAVEQGTLPAACRIASALVPSEFLERLCGQARSNVFDTGWLVDQYRACLEENKRQIGLSRSYSGQEGGIDPDADVYEDDDSPRRVLREAIRRGDGRNLSENEMTEAVLRFIGQLPLEAAAAGVVGSSSLRVDPGERPQSLPPCPAWFAPPPHYSELVPAVLASVVRIAATAPSGLRVGLGALVSPEGLVVASNRVVADARQIQVQLADASRREATVVRTLPKCDLTLLQVEDMPEEGAVAAELSDREPQLGDPILTPSPPERDPEQPEVALGLMVFRDARASGNEDETGAFGASYRSLAGPAGSPVFNLQGELIGIHRSVRSPNGNSGGEMVRPVVGASAVRSLLAGGDDDAASSIGMDHELAPIRDGGAESPSRFLTALFAADPDPVGFLPQHWIDADEQHMPELILGKRELEFTTLHGLAAQVEFLQPVRAIVHRVDVTAPLAARELVSCGSATPA